MRIPKFLHQFRHTRLWRYKWIVLLITTTVTVLLIVSSYKFYYNRTNQEATNRLNRLIDTWNANGIATSTQNFYPCYEPGSQDLHTHPAFVKELNQVHAPQFGSLQSLNIPGVRSYYDTEPYDPYSDEPEEVIELGSYGEGVAANIKSWLDPKQPDLTDTQTALIILDLIKPVSLRLDGLSNAIHESSPHFKSHDQNLVFSPSIWDVYNSSAELLEQRSILYLRSGNIEKSYNDISTIIQLSKHAGDSPALIGTIVQAGMLASLQQPLWEGLKTHSYNEETLNQLGKDLSEANLHTSFLRSIPTELAFVCESLQTTTHAISSSSYSFRFPSWPTWEESGGKASPWKNFSLYLTKWKRTLTPPGKPLLDYIICLEKTQLPLLYKNGNIRTSLPWSDIKTIPHNLLLDYGSIAKSLSYTQAAINNLQTAVALERYYIKHQSYPTKLSSLVPEFLPATPIDYFTGKPLSYKIKSDGTPLIYSVGPDLIDNGGDTTDDISWMYTPTP